MLLDQEWIYGNLSDLLTKLACYLSQAISSNFIGDVFGLLMMLGARSWGGPDK